MENLSDSGAIEVLKTRMIGFSKLLKTIGFCEAEDSIIGEVLRELHHH